MKANTRISIFGGPFGPEVWVPLRAGGGCAPEAFHTKAPNKILHFIPQEYELYFWGALSVTVIEFDCLSLF